MVQVITGSDAAAGEIVLACRPAQCEAVRVGDEAASPTPKRIPSRREPFASSRSRATAPRNTKAAIFIAESEGRHFQMIRGLWSTAGIADEVVEVFARHAVGALNASAATKASASPAGRIAASRSPPSCRRPMPPISIARRSSARPSAYFLATLPNAGAEALLSHLTVGAHARLAEDGRRAVAQMGNQQRASADVLIMFGQAIEREQRRMRSFERFMPEPIDPMLRSRIADMEKGITSVWTSIGITSSPFVPACRAAARTRWRRPPRARARRRHAAAPLTSPAAFAIVRRTLATSSTSWATSSMASDRSATFATRCRRSLAACRCRRSWSISSDSPWQARSSCDDERRRPTLP